MKHLREGNVQLFFLKHLTLVSKKLIRRYYFEKNKDKQCEGRDMESV